MEPKVEEKSDESFLKIDTIWSEAERNFENITVKEEAVSDLEPECVLVVQENDIKNVEEQQSDDLKSSQSSKKKCDDIFSNGMITSSQLYKKRAKNKSSKSSKEQSEVVYSKELTCLHDAENLKIFKRRLRCGNCRSVVCPECCEVMISTLQNHLSGCDGHSLGIYPCKLCGLAFHSLCALQAHIRIHTMSTPYVCPDCGLIYNNIYFLILHLINKCYHVYKVVRYKCKNCPGVYFSADMFTQHVQSQHIEFVFKCSYCTSSFSNCEKFKYHMDAVHQKQKVQYLNYFRCSLCSNMVIPKIMYENHVSQHCDSMDSYEVDYQCLCGYIYGLIGGFRVHVQHCNKKGILPPHWSFLQKKLKSHERAPAGGSENKGGAEARVRKLNPPKKQGQNLNENSVVNEIGTIQKIELLVGNNVLVKSDIQEARNQQYSLCDKEISGPMQDFSVKPGDEEWEASNVDSKASAETLSDSNALKDSNEVQSQAEASEPGDADFSQTEVKISELPSIQSEEEYPKQSAVDALALDSIRENFDENQTENNCKECEEVDPDGAKILYDHIPRDHLGYVIKSQSSEAAGQASQMDDSPAQSQARMSPKNCHIVTELDEKTGLITAKQVAAEDWEEENQKEETNNTDDDCDEEFDAGSFRNFLPKFFRNGKPKFRVGNAFFTCPFCIVLFPKYNSTFQQFRLHLESYHPDAALNLTVENDSPASSPENYKILFEDSDNNVDVQNKAKAADELATPAAKLPSLKTNSAKHSQKKSEARKIKENSSASRKGEGKGSDLENSQDGSVDSEEKGKEESNAAREEKVFYEEEKENLAKEPNKVFKGYAREKNVCWTVKLSLQKSDILFEGNESTMSEGEAKKKNEGPRSNAAEGEAFARQEGMSKFSEACEAKGYFEKLTKNPGAHVEKSRKSGDKMEEGFNSDSNENDCEGKYVETNEKVEEKKGADFGVDCGILKNLKWSSISEISMKETKEPGVESKSEEKERSRRESEVWSEFYESLKLAEKLKKNKEKHAEGKRKSVVSDYSTKRIVKKPKRYRESSESEYSFGGNENSESEGEFLLQNNFGNDFRSEKSKEDEENCHLLLTKKQKLLSKLQNADNKFLDYLFELISKKEKCSELYKKHSSLRASRYSQDLHSYRKKVLDGIKHRGRPHKLLRYHEFMKKKAKEAECQGEDKKNPESCSENSKGGEKKRGRPRKMVDPSKVKERRRSDKEVDFIEKNFEREENESSPSKRKRKLSSKLQYYKNINLGDEREDFSSGLVITNKPMDSSKKFSCAVCKEVFPEASEFREHILGHRMEENSYQCMECGECFVVRPSLEKHLHAFHKIKNTDKYITENQCCNIRKESSEADNEPLKENQCKVCKDQFDRPIDLTKHFRIHGMAFLKEFKREGKTK